MNKEKLYESPCTMEIELVLEQTILAASAGPYPSFSDEEEW